MESNIEEIDPQFLHGFTVAELEANPRKCLLSGGLQRFSEARSALHAKYLFKDGGSREEIAKDKTPTWQKFSGLTPERERSVRPREREEMIFSLLKAAETLIRWELKEEASRKREGANVLERGRSLAWDPVRAVCFHLEISQRKLSGYAKEVMGISIWEMADAVRAESVRGRLKTELKAFVAGFMGSRKDAKTQRTGTERSTTENTEGTEEGIGERIFLALKQSRRTAGFHRSSWALSLGFSSYTRFFRACLNCFGMTPHQLELALIEDILVEAEGRNDSNNGNHEGLEERKRHEVQKDEAEVVKRE